jgi:DNA replication factor GINS
MNLDELQSVQARERQSSDLQHLRSSFYREVGEFIEDLNQQRARLVEEADDPFSDPEIRRLTDDIETAEGTVEAIYERRVGKVVKKASIAAAGMPIEDDGLTSEEEALFEDLVERIESNREAVLTLLDGDSPSVSCSIDDEPASSDRTDAPSEAGRSTADPDPAPTTDEGVNAADLMGDGADPTTEAPSPEDDLASPQTDSSPMADRPPDPTPPSTSAEDSAPSSGNVGSPPTVSADPSENRQSRPDETPGMSASEPTPEPETQSRTSGTESTDGSLPGLPRTTVRITADVGEIVGADDRDYDLGAEDVVTLPEPNADVLVKKDAAERLQ